MGRGNTSIAKGGCVYSRFRIGSVINEQLFIPSVAKGRRSFAHDPSLNVTVRDSQEQH